MKEARKTKRKKRERLGNRLALVGITFVVLSMAVVVNMRSASLRERDFEYQKGREPAKSVGTGGAEGSQTGGRAGLCPDEAVYREGGEGEAWPG